MYCDFLLFLYPVCRRRWLVAPYLFFLPNLLLLIKPTLTVHASQPRKFPLYSVLSVYFLAAPAFWQIYWWPKAVSCLVIKVGPAFLPLLGWFFAPWLGITVFL
jgi:hypothetical protein